MHYPSTLTATLGLISLVLAGCASTKTAVLPQDGPSMKAIYEAHLQKGNTQDPQAIRSELGHRTIVKGGSDLQGYTRDAFNEIEALFPRLANPTLVIYVFPHLAGESQAPVPGYATAFTLYEQVEYALPGELVAKPAGNSQ